MRYYRVDYKDGKHFVIQDELDDLDYSIGMINDYELTDDFLKEHIENCDYYGIPPAITENKQLEKRIDNLRKKYEK